MARARTLHPDFFTDEKVVQVCFAARLLFQGLWCEADREGRLECKPLTLKMRLFPADPVDVNELLGELIESGLIRSYMVDGEAYLLVPKLAKRQRFHPREMPSHLPAPLGEPQPDSGAPKANLGTPQPEKIPAGREIPSGSSGSSGPSGSSGSSGPSAAPAAPSPPEEQAEPPRIANPDSPSLKFFVRAEDTRTQAGLAREKPPHPSKLASWHSTALGELNGDEERLWEGWLCFGDDPYWQQRKCPFNGFMSQWEKYAPPRIPLRP